MTHLLQTLAVWLFSGKPLFSTDTSLSFPPDPFTTGMHWLLERTVGTGTNGVSYGLQSFSYLDFVDDITLLTELLELLVPTLETMSSEAAYLRLKVN